MQNKASSLQKERHSIGKAAEYLGVSIDTLRRWDKKGRITSLRSPGGHRYFLKRDLDNLFGKKYVRETPKISAKPISSPAPSPREFKPVVVEQTESIYPIFPQQPSQPKYSKVELEDEAKKLINSHETPPSKLQAAPVDKKTPWKKILIIGFTLFAIVDLILLIVYFVSSRPPLSPIP